MAIPGKKSLVMPLVLLILGIVLLVIWGVLYATKFFAVKVNGVEEMWYFKSWKAWLSVIMLILGIVLTLWGLIVLIVRINHNKSLRAY